MDMRRRRFDTLGKLGSAHRARGTPPSEGGVPRARWVEHNYPSVINKPAAPRPDASEKFMTEATSMLAPTISWPNNPV